MADVREPGMLWLQFTDQGERLLHSRMHWVRSVAQRVQNQVVEAAEQLERSGRDRAEIREIRERADAESVNRNGAVLRQNRDNVQSKEFECSIERMNFDLRNGALHRLGLENVSKSAA